MAIMQMRTTYRGRPHLVSSFQYLSALPFRHTLRPFRYGTKQEFDVPTIIDKKYTNREYFPSNVNTSVQNVLERSSLYHSIFVVQLLCQLTVAFLRTIVSINTVRQLRHFVQNVLLGERDLQF